ncbi:nucleoside diphosphate kinase 7-like [Cydia amplana]|uniref:nucleoside diphosphate kinase 7-like n=1 Tax=Cydia amplana TaxID=1869771 RepID=UPI002FE56A60
MPWNRSKIAVFDYFDKYIFLCEMYDEETDTMVELVLNFFPFDNSVQVIDPQKGKNLLRRVQLPTLTMEMLQIGNIVNIFAKLILIRDCAPITKRTLFNKMESTFAFIKPGPPSDNGKILTYIMKKGFRIVRMKNAKVTKELAMEIYQNCAGGEMLPIIIDYVTSGEVVALELVAPDAVKYFRSCLGATDPKKAAPGTLRYLYGHDTLRNVAHGCNTREDAAKIIDWFFGQENNRPKVPYQATLKDCTCCVIKPHVLIDGHLGNVIDRISTSDIFYISAMAMFSVKIHDAKEFFEIYKGVLPEYEEMCIHLSEGKCVALEVKCNKPNMNVVQEFRKFCGPRDPDLCRQLYPDSLRALYGKNYVHNAVHCTDLDEDAELEVEYFFKLLANMHD